jgi:hypothetical protein
VKIYSLSIKREREGEEEGDDKEDVRMYNSPYFP